MISSPPTNQSRRRPDNNIDPINLRNRRMNIEQVLLVDDDPSIRKIAEISLSRVGNVSKSL